METLASFFPANFGECRTLQDQDWEKRNETIQQNVYFQVLAVAMGMVVTLH